MLILGSFLLFNCKVKKYTTVRIKKKAISTKKPIYKPKHPTIKQTQTVKMPERKIVPKNTRDYIKRYAPIAIREMNIYGIPASITLAQGILESGSGRSNLAMRSNNHFGIKCHKEWDGKSVTHDDDLVGECFRKYVHPETSYEDHSKFLAERKRYASLFKLRKTDYKAWAYGLKKAGYATDRRYPAKLIQLIKRYNLHQYDVGQETDFNETKIEEKPISRPKPMPTKNIQTYTIIKGDTLYSIARKNNISVDKLKKLNKLTSNNLQIGQVLKLE